MTTPEATPTNRIEIYTDGACIGNPGPGGWGAILRSLRGDKLLKELHLSGPEADTTNNRMELMAVIEALEAIKKTRPITVFTDSQYVSRGATKRLAGWKAKGWKKSDQKPVANIDLWKSLDTLLQKYDVTFKWVRGHAGNALNEAADALASEEARAVAAEASA